jgi:hypothetical protein
LYFVQVWGWSTRGTNSYGLCPFLFTWRRKNTQLPKRSNFIYICNLDKVQKIFLQISEDIDHNTRRWFAQENSSQVQAAESIKGIYYEQNNIQLQSMWQFGSSDG